MNLSGRLDTNTPNIDDIIKDIKKGEIKIPKFQRRFLWSSRQALDLLDSISNNYPIGSLLLWKTLDKLKVERDIGDFLFPKTDDITPTSYVLDGQQRITVIYSCLGAISEDDGFAAAFDLEKNEFIEYTKSTDPDKLHQLTLFPDYHILPLRVIYDTSKWLDFRTGLRNHPKHGELAKRADQLFQAITKYKIPVITLRDLTVEEVCPIFERINNSGTKLSMYDLLVAATWSPKFDLNDELEKISSALERKGFGDITGDTMIKCIAVVTSKGVNRDDILRIRKVKSQMGGIINTVREALLKVVDFIATEFNVYSWDFLPYEAIAVILCSVFEKSQVLDKEQRKRAREWFWRASFSERYRGASDTYITSDVTLVREYVLEGKGTPEIFGAIPSANRLKDVEFRRTNSLSRAFILALATAHPRNLTNGAKIDVSGALSSFNQKEFHHIYPKAFLKRTKKITNYDSLINICMLAASENKRISDDDPNDYLPKAVTLLGAEATAVFQSNLLPDPNTSNYRKLDFHSFLEQRVVVLDNYLSQLCKGYTP